MYKQCLRRRTQCCLLYICVGGFFLIALLFHQNEDVVKSELERKPATLSSLSPSFIWNDVITMSGIQKPKFFLQMETYKNAADKIREIQKLKTNGTNSSRDKHAIFNSERKSSAIVQNQGPKKQAHDSNKIQQKGKNISQKVEAILQHDTRPLKEPMKGWTPPSHAGEGGVAVKIDTNQLSDDQRQMMDEGQKQHGFNQFLSSHISLHRTLRTVTEPECRQQPDVSQLPPVTVVVVFHNEAWSSLLRTVHSIVDRSPPSLLHKVILVDDFSDLDHLKNPLDEYVSRVLAPTVKVIRSGSRDGIVSARLLGLNDVTTPVVIFLDSHCEVVEGWLEPLLDRIAKDPTTVAVPVIDVINGDDFGYYLTDSRYIQVGAFNWYLQFYWMNIPPAERHRRRSNVEPIRTPTMSGGIFAIDKNYFLKLGTYDPAMKIWGGENLELSFKVWMCGGRLEIVPCSHVGHVFRESVRDPARDRPSLLSTNLQRVATVWLDDYSYYSNQARAWDQTNATVIGDVSERQALRRHLQCHSFAWYLMNVMPDLYLPADLIAHGPIRSEVWDLCISTSLQNYRQAHLLKCHDNEFSQQWSMNDGQFTVLQDSYFQGFTCLDYHGNRTVKTLQCTGTGESQLWKYSQELRQLIHTSSGLCAEVSTDSPDTQDAPHSPRLLLAPCKHGNRRQQWRWNTTAVPGPSWRKDLAAGRPVL